VHQLLNIYFFAENNYIYLFVQNLVVVQLVASVSSCSRKGGGTEKKTDRLCSDDETWGEDGKAQR
jgi:hypothetical protein